MEIPFQKHNHQDHQGQQEQLEDEEGYRLIRMHFASITRI
jgi:hypothetical protein